jgi:hypothetical protein
MQEAFQKSEEMEGFLSRSSARKFGTHDSKHSRIKGELQED